MYRIILTTWYQELPGDGKQLEILPNKFEFIDEAVKFLSKNIDEIIEYFPVDSIEIKFLNKEG